MGLLILKYSTLLSFHRFLHARDSMTGSKKVTFILPPDEVVQWLFEGHFVLVRFAIVAMEEVGSHRQIFQP